MSLMFALIDWLAEARLRQLLHIPKDYKVLYFQGPSMDNCCYSHMLLAGGAHAQFSAIPLNLLGWRKLPQPASADYVITGFWSDRSYGEGQKQAGGSDKFRKLDVRDGNGAVRADWLSMLNPDADYVHLCGSETIDGIEFLEDPDLSSLRGSDGKSPLLVGDFTSTLLSRAINVSRYSAIYASGGKNLVRCHS
jgi:phosphoserine aminotransferase